MSKQFDLEQEIMNCWNTASDLKYLYQAVLDKDLTKDQIANILLGIYTLHEVKCDRLFDTFESFLKENHGRSR